MPPQTTKENHSPEKASMLKKNFEDSYSSSDLLEKCISKQAKLKKIFVALHVLNLALTLALIGFTVYFFRDTKQQLQPTELEAERLSSSGEGEYESCCDEVLLLKEAREQSDQRVAALENHLHDVKRMLGAQLKADDQALKAAAQPVASAPVPNIGLHRGIVKFEEPKTDIELPVLAEGSGGGSDLPPDYIFFDNYDDDPENEEVEVLSPDDVEMEGSGGHGHHHHAPKKCIETIKPMCPNDCYDQVKSEAGCLIPVCCHHK